VQWLNAPDDAEPRSVGALRGFFNLRLTLGGRNVSFDNINEVIRLVAANDNVRLDLIESALAPADFPMAA
jgi:hypothetical protein